MNRFAKLGYAVLAYARDPAGFVRLIRQLPLLARLYWRVFRDGRTGWRPRLIMLATLAYVISPFDLIPVVVLPGIGLLDDLAILIYGCKTFLAMAPPDVVSDHAAALAEDRMPTS